MLGSLLPRKRGCESLKADSSASAVFFTSDIVLCGEHSLLRPPDSSTWSQEGISETKERCEACWPWLGMSMRGKSRDRFPAVVTVVVEPGRSLPSSRTLQQL